MGNVWNRVDSRVGQTSGNKGWGKDNAMYRPICIEQETGDKVALSCEQMHLYDDSNWWQGGSELWTDASIWWFKLVTRWLWAVNSCIYMMIQTGDKVALSCEQLHLYDDSNWWQGGSELWTVASIWWFKLVTRWLWAVNRCIYMMIQTGDKVALSCEQLHLYDDSNWWQGGSELWTDASIWWFKLVTRWLWAVNRCIYMMIQTGDKVALSCEQMHLYDDSNWWQGGSELWTDASIWWFKLVTRWLWAVNRCIYMMIQTGDKVALSCEQLHLYDDSNWWQGGSELWTVASIWWFKLVTRWLWAVNRCIYMMIQTGDKVALSCEQMHLYDDSNWWQGGSELWTDASIWWFKLVTRWLWAVNRCIYMMIQTGDKVALSCEQMHLYDDSNWWQGGSELWTDASIWWFKLVTRWLWAVNRCIYMMIQTGDKVALSCEQMHLYDDSNWWQCGSELWTVASIWWFKLVTRWLWAVNSCIYMMIQTGDKVALSCEQLHLYDDSNWWHGGSELWTDASIWWFKLVTRWLWAVNRCIYMMIQTGDKVALSCEQLHLYDDSNWWQGGSELWTDASIWWFKLVTRWLWAVNRCIYMMIQTGDKVALSCEQMHLYDDSNWWQGGSELWTVASIWWFKLVTRWLWAVNSCIYMMIQTGDKVALSCEQMHLYDDSNWWQGGSELWTVASIWWFKLVTRWLWAVNRCIYMMIQTGDKVALSCEQMHLYDDSNWWQGGSELWTDASIWWFKLVTRWLWAVNRCIYMMIQTGDKVALSCEQMHLYDDSNWWQGGSELWTDASIWWFKLVTRWLWAVNSCIYMMIQTGDKVALSCEQMHLYDDSNWWQGGSELWTDASIWWFKLVTRWLWAVNSCIYMMIQTGDKVALSCEQMHLYDDSNWLQGGSELWTVASIWWFKLVTRWLWAVNSCIYMMIQTGDKVALSCEQLHLYDDSNWWQGGSELWTDASIWWFKLVTRWLWAVNRCIYMMIQTGDKVALSCEQMHLYDDSNWWQGGSELWTVASIWWFKLVTRWLWAVNRCIYMMIQTGDKVALSCEQMHLYDDSNWWQGGSELWTDASIWWFKLVTRWLWAVNSCIYMMIQTGDKVALSCEQLHLYDDSNWWQGGSELWTDASIWWFKLVTRWLWAVNSCIYMMIQTGDKVALSCEQMYLYDDSNWWQGGSELWTDASLWLAQSNL